MNHRWKHGSWKIVCINYESLDSISSSSNEGSMVQFILLCILRNKNDKIQFVPDWAASFDPYSGSFNCMKAVGFIAWLIQ